MLTRAFMPATIRRTWTVQSGPTLDWSVREGAATEPCRQLSVQGDPASCGCGVRLRLGRKPGRLRLQMCCETARIWAQNKVCRHVLSGHIPTHCRAAICQPRFFESLLQGVLSVCEEDEAHFYPLRIASRLIVCYPCPGSPRSGRNH